MKAVSDDFSKEVEVTGHESWIAICRIDDIPRLGARRVQRPQGPPAALFRTADDRVFALLDRCPHKGGPLSQGLVFGERVACPLHQWSIGLVDGRAAAPDEGCAARFAVLVQAGVVHMDATELARPAPETEGSVPACGTVDCASAGG